MLTEQECEVDKFGKVWYNKNSLTNIFSLAEMASKYKVTFDSEKENAFVIHMQNKEVKFNMMRNGLYGMKPREMDDERKQFLQLQMLNTLEENKRFYSERQLERVKKARDFIYALGCPSTEDI